MTQTVRLIPVALATLLVTALAAFAQVVDPQPGFPNDSVPAPGVTVGPGRDTIHSSRPAAKQYNAAMAREWQALDYVTVSYLALMPDDGFLRIQASTGRRPLLKTPTGVKSRSDESRRSNLPRLGAPTLAQAYISDSTLESLVDWYTRQYGFEFVIHHTLLDDPFQGDTLTVARAVKRVQNTMVSIMIWNPTVTTKGKKSKEQTLAEKTSITVQERAYRSREEMIVEGPDAIVELTWKVPYRDLIQKVSFKHQIDPFLVAALVQQESNFNPGAMSVDSAMGLTQMIPGTAEMMGVDDPSNPKQSLEGGVRYLKMMLKRFKGDVRLALAAYNAGPGNVEKYRGIPPFSETQNYVKRIMTRYEEKVTGRPATGKWLKQRS